jgi:RNA polymerase sigma-70 factor (ECF subfamily)
LAVHTDLSRRATLSSRRLFSGDLQEQGPAVEAFFMKDGSTANETDSVDLRIVGGKGYAMVDEKARFRAALEDVRSGSPEAVWHFISEYGPSIQRIVRRKMDRRMQSKFDSIDFVQMVWASFFRNPREIRSFRHPDDLLRYLAALARHKVISEYRRRIHSTKHGVTNECSLTDSDTAEAMPSSPEMTPSQVAMAREEWDRLMQSQSTRDQEIVRLRFGGATFVEISQRLGIHERTVRKVIERLTHTSRFDAKHET